MVGKRLIIETIAADLLASPVWDNKEQRASNHFLKGPIMTTSERVAVLDRSVNVTHRWLDEVKHAAMCADRDDALTAMRGTFHALRDRLVPDEAADLASQLPTFLRGVYYEGYKPSRTPTKERHADEFLENVRSKLGTRGNIDPSAAVRGTLKALDHRVSEGEIEDIRNIMPPELRGFWPAH